LHFDLYGMAGLEFDGDIDGMAGYIAGLAEDLKPFALQIETPFDFRSRDAQIEGFVALRRALELRGSAVRLVADEWCDTLADVREYARHRGAHMLQIKMPDMGSIADSAEAVLHCRASGLAAYLGGSCAETDLSARYSVHVGLATQPEMLLAKPGMGVDEALSIVGNEQARVLAQIWACNRRRG
jgi:methylaspartate ammonia-lyase